MLFVSALCLFSWKVIPNGRMTVKYELGRMWKDVVVEVLFHHLHVVRGLRIEFKIFHLQKGVLATELWHLVPVYMSTQTDTEVSIQLYIVT